MNTYLFFIDFDEKYCKLIIRYNIVKNSYLGEESIFSNCLFGQKSTFFGKLFRAENEVLKVEIYYDTRNLKQLNICLILVKIFSTVLIYYEFKRKIWNIYVFLLPSLW